MDFASGRVDAFLAGAADGGPPSGEALDDADAAPAGVRGDRRDRVAAGCDPLLLLLRWPGPDARDTREPRSGEQTCGDAVCRVRVWCRDQIPVVVGGPRVPLEARTGLVAFVLFSTRVRVLRVLRVGFPGHLRTGWSDRPADHLVVVGSAVVVDHPPGLAHGGRLLLEHGGDLAGGSRPALRRA